MPRINITVKNVNPAEFLNNPAIDALDFDVEYDDNSIDINCEREREEIYKIYDAIYQECFQVYHHGDDLMLKEFMQEQFIWFKIHCANEDIEDNFLLWLKNNCKPFDFDTEIAEYFACVKSKFSEKVA